EANSITRRLHLPPWRPTLGQTTPRRNDDAAKVTARDQPVGCVNSVTDDLRGKPARVGLANSGGLVFVDESTEQIATAKADGLCQRRRVAAVRREQLESAVWPVLVVVAAVNAKHLREMAAAEDKDPIETVAADSAHPTLGEGVCVRRLDKRADHLYALRPKDLVERAAELTVAIMDEEPERLLILELHGEVARLLGD